jgi:hypothetical protein
MYCVTESSEEPSSGDKIMITVAAHTLIITLKIAQQENFNLTIPTEDEEPSKKIRSE